MGPWPNIFILQTYERSFTDCRRFSLTMITQSGVVAFYPPDFSAFRIALPISRAFVLVACFYNAGVCSPLTIGSPL